MVFVEIRLEGMARSSLFLRMWLAYKIFYTCFANVVIDLPSFLTSFTYSTNLIINISMCESSSSHLLIFTSFIPFLPYFQMIQFMPCTYNNLYKTHGSALIGIMEQVQLPSRGTTYVSFGYRILYESKNDSVVPFDRHKIYIHCLRIRHQVLGDFLIMWSITTIMRGHPTIDHHYFEIGGREIRILPPKKIITSDIWGYFAELDLLERYVSSMTIILPGTGYRVPEIFYSL